MVLDTFGPNLKFIIDLTKASRYYDFNPYKDRVTRFQHKLQGYVLLMICIYVGVLMRLGLRAVDIFLHECMFAEV